MRFLALLLVVSGCVETPSVRDSGTQLDDAGVAACLAKEGLDAGAVEAGRAFLLGTEIGGGFVPRLAWDNLYLVWGTGRPSDVPAAMRARYGLAPALTQNDGLPMGFQQVGAWVNASCLVCHAGEVAGQTVIGAPNTQVDLELLVDDVKALAALNGTPLGPMVTVRTGAKGIGDIIGMTIQLGLQTVTPPIPVNEQIGFQDAPAWWGLAAKTRVYADGSASSSGHRTFMATQLAFGTTEAQLRALEPKYIALRQYLLSLSAPPWPFEPPDEGQVLRGAAVYEAKCASCHGAAACDRTESLEVARASVGTDPDRGTQFGAGEAAVINGSWFGQVTPMRSTGGYIAPPLRGLWASAPYFHNGSVPTLEGVLDSSKRPAFFRTLGTSQATFDSAAVGLKVEVLASAPVSPPRALKSAVYDTTRPGLSNAGHLYGDALSLQQRVELIAFLKVR